MAKIWSLTKNFTALFKQGHLYFSVAQKMYWSLIRTCFKKVGNCRSSVWQRAWAPNGQLLHCRLLIRLARKKLPLEVLCPAPDAPLRHRLVLLPTGGCGLQREKADGVLVIEASICMLSWLVQTCKLGLTPRNRPFLISRPHSLSNCFIMVPKSSINGSIVLFFIEYDWSTSNEAIFVLKNETYSTLTQPNLGPILRLEMKPRIQLITTRVTRWSNLIN